MMPSSASCPTKPDSQNSREHDVPMAKLPRLTQYTAIGSSSFSPSLSTVNRTNTRSNKFATLLNVRRRFSCHTGLNPLFFTELVRAVTTREVLVPFEAEVGVPGEGDEVV